MKKEITEKENDLLEAIRNYRSSGHNRSKNLLEYAQMVFDELLFD